ncbi:winged helix-turn-helix transcriptional regulator [Methanolobus vulcani]|uniref:Winged helix-turn-helix transcriptional regulator n=1 Tax=Methanolobus vulcani TaxID=38026 RepID=A0A7Z8KML2_9EURY|nr:winged helix-turn-helix transcriptional regulator [Methanolobus vulcani]TQD24955.1 winged helix-turn-helix transcriptional regulator [Methanolobus vulcani]
MKVTSFAGCIAILLILSTVAGAENTATVHGVAYDWSTLAPLDNVIIEVNSTPAQSIVAKYGVYSFDLPEGNYRITASYYMNNDLICYDEEDITIADEGNYVVDLLLIPSYSNNSTQETISSISSSSVHSSINLLTLSVIVVLILLASLVFKIRNPEKTGVLAKKQENRSKSFPNNTGKTNSSHLVLQNTSASKNSMHNQQSAALSSEHLEILDIIRSAGGTMSQKELRKHLSYSEGKASVMIFDLENRGYIKKVKKGRGNILYLIEMDA